MNFELWVSLRYLRAKRKQIFISVITFLSVIGITVGVMALIIVISVMNGFTEDLKEKILGTSSHVVVYRQGKEIERYHELRRQLLEIEGVKGATPFIYREVMLRAGDKVTGIVLRSIDPATAGEVVDLNRTLKIGRLEDLDTSEAMSSMPGIILGQELGRHLGVGKGDPLVLISPLGELTPWGLQPKWKRFRVSGIFDAGYWEYDSKLAFISLKEGQRFFKIPDKVTGIEIKVNDIYRAREIAERIQKTLGYPYWTTDWMKMNRNLLFALKLEKRVMFIILSCIVLVAGLSIVSTLVMVVMEKTKDISILKAMGARSNLIRRIFVFEGLIVGLVGTTLGCLFGLLISFNIESIVSFIEGLIGVQFMPGDVYYISELPAKVNGLDVMGIIIVTMTICWLATLYPAGQAARLDPAEGLRYE